MFLLLGFFSECRFVDSRPSLIVGRFVALRILASWRFRFELARLLAPRLFFKSRLFFKRPLFLAPWRFVAVAVLSFPKAPFSRRIVALLRPIGQSLIPDVVFLVRPPDLQRKFIGGMDGNLKLRRRIQNSDRADVLLADIAAATNHRQQPASFGILPPSDRGAKPDTALWQPAVL